MPEATFLQLTEDVMAIITAELFPHHKDIMLPHYEEILWVAHYLGYDVTAAKAKADAAAVKAGLEPRPIPTIEEHTEMLKMMDAVMNTDHAAKFADRLETIRLEIRHD
jgi:hypothetical protein